MKAQKSGNSMERISVNLPLEYTKLLGWKQGDTLNISKVNVKENYLVIEKIGE